MGIMRDFPGSPGVKTLHFYCRGQVQSLVGELWGMAKKKNWGVEIPYMVILSINHCADGDQHS